MLQHSIVAFFGFGRRDVADGLQDPPIVELVEGSVLHRLKRAPRPAPVDDLGLIEAIERLGERVVVRVADTANRGLNAGLGQALGVLDRGVLHPPVGVVDESSLWTSLPLLARALLATMRSPSRGL